MGSCGPAAISGWCPALQGCAKFGGSVPPKPAPKEGEKQAGRKRRKHQGEVMHEGRADGEQPRWVLPASSLTQDLEEFCSFMVPCTPDLPILPLTNHLSLEQSSSARLCCENRFSTRKSRRYSSRSGAGEGMLCPWQSYILMFSSLLIQLLFQVYGQAQDHSHRPAPTLHVQIFHLGFQGVPENP